MKEQIEKYIRRELSKMETREHTKGLDPTNLKISDILLHLDAILLFNLIETTFNLPIIPYTTKTFPHSNHFYMTLQELIEYTSTNQTPHKSEIIENLSLITKYYNPNGISISMPMPYRIIKRYWNIDVCYINVISAFDKHKNYLETIS